MIFKYHQWLEESEKTEAPAGAQDLGTAPADQTPAEMATPPAEPEADTDAEPKKGELEKIDDTSEIGKFRKLDQARRDAVKAFKEKQKEFLEMPDETRKNPTSDEDKQKVEALKTELIALSKTMKEAEAAFNKFNDEMLGLSPDVEGEGEDVEP